MELFTYDFGYAWPWNYGHLLAVVPGAALAVLAWKQGWAWWMRALSVGLAVWGVVGLFIVQVVFRFNQPVDLPTEDFLPEGTGLVFDAGAGSGRSALMVLQAPPATRVLALDLYEGYFGIVDNTPSRLRYNASLTAVKDRIEVRVGDIREMPLSDTSVDAVVSVAVIDHLSRQGVERSLTEIERMFRPEGQFLPMVVNPDIRTLVAFPFFAHHGYWGGRTNHDQWRDALTAVGFAVVEVGTVPMSLYLLAEKRSAAWSADLRGEPYPPSSTRTGRRTPGPTLSPPYQGRSYDPRGNRNPEVGIRFGSAGTWRSSLRRSRSWASSVCSLSASSACTAIGHCRSCCSSASAGRSPAARGWRGRTGCTGVCCMAFERGRIGPTSSGPSVARASGRWPPSRVSLCSPDRWT